MATLQFAPWSSEIELGFYASLASLKINHDRLDDSARKVLGVYELRPTDPPERSARMQILGNALTSDEPPKGSYRAEGILKNVNTIEEYKKLDRTVLVERAGRTVWDAIKDGTIYSCPSLLCSFYTISFANLKKYKFTYHYAYPAIHTDPPWQLAGEEKGEPSRLSAQETTALVDTVQTWKYGVDFRQHGFFLAKRIRANKSLDEAFRRSSGSPAGENHPPKTPTTPDKETLGYQWAVASLSSFESDFFKDVDSQDQYICFADPSTYPKSPGWMLRNLLILIRERWKLSDVQILCYRDTHRRRDQANSIILHLQLPSAPEPSSTMPKVTGWERNDQGKINSRMMDLSEYMDPTRLADQAVDLNLKLIKWRIAPNLNIDIIKSTKCLLLGAGTLGSYVSRILMGYGVRKITFVDNANVSFSNPVRQPLFDFKDCLEGGAKKADRAAQALLEIFPGVDAKGHVMSVPMAGHPIMDEAKVKGEFEKLKRLIEEHDAIFLLMDTRESRWLPTVMGKAAGKIVMNAALGFDTYVVMRHGLKTTGNLDGEEQELGCYFCNDVVAPADSVKDATLDQQCTVTRPGIAPIASALLVELLASIVQHPSAARAPASTTGTPAAGSFKHPLGLLPHQIRGYLSNFDAKCITGQPYDCCSACSDGIISRYQNDGWDFVKRAINEKGWVEEISGLAEVQRLAEAADKDVEWDESDDEGALEAEGELL
ncbi:E1-like protein-activating [Aulographum hederae CBS 113979]|uniref:Ubiquitin-like modifier-activating enzyme ATG7 n=1 Tax=Aulographum hederae CBS 113979 TaxID=1176131 RepID=A0A6G1GRP3_9PEZI|nr:E1-like protein-activating [Aulographum hederae CBS 113979]